MSHCLTASARLSESGSLILSLPVESVWPSISILQVEYLRTNASAFWRSARSALRMVYLLVSKLTWIVSLSVGFGLTVMVVESERDPPGPFAVSVYFVVVVGHTCLVPLGLTLPTSGSIETLVALVVDQFRFVQALASSEESDAVSEAVGAGSAGGGGAAGAGGGGGAGFAGQSALILLCASDARAFASPGLH